MWIFKNLTWISSDFGLSCYELQNDGSRSLERVTRTDFTQCQFSIESLKSGVDLWISYVDFFVFWSFRFLRQLFSKFVTFVILHTCLMLGFGFSVMGKNNKYLSKISNRVQEFDTQVLLEKNLYAQLSLTFENDHFEVYNRKKTKIRRNPRKISENPHPIKNFR